MSYYDSRGYNMFEKKGLASLLRSTSFVNFPLDHHKFVWKQNWGQKYTLNRNHEKHHATIALR